METTTAEVVVGCPPGLLDATMDFFLHKLGFRLLKIFPADAPRIVVLEGHSTRLRLTTPANGSVPAPASILRLETVGTDSDLSALNGTVAPNGTCIEVADSLQPYKLPPISQSFVISRSRGAREEGVGRAGMLYRDLVPERQGGRFVGSHIRIPNGGPVGDYPHYHRLRFQFVYLYKGWVKLAYEGQVRCEILSNAWEIRWTLCLTGCVLLGPTFCYAGR